MNWKSLPVPPETLCPQHTVFAHGQSNDGVVADLNGVVADLEIVGGGTTSQFPQICLTITFPHDDFKRRNAMLAEIKKLLDNNCK